MVNSLTNKIIFNKSKRSIKLHDLAELISRRTPHQEGKQVPCRVGFFSDSQVPLEKLNRLVQRSLVVVCGYGKNPSSRSGRKRRLVSFGHATGDGVMIACIEEILVHPDYEALGLEDITLKMLMEHLNTLDLGEVCTRVKSQDLSLFTSNGFRSDRENSVLMKLSSNWVQENAILE